MADLRFSKVVGTLPGSLTPDTFYSVRVGDGFDFYLTDTAGVARKLNAGDAAALTAEITEARNGRSTLHKRISTISNFASPNAAAFLPSRYYDQSFHGSNSQNITVQSNRIEIWPFYFSQALTFDRIGVATTGAVAGAQTTILIYQTDDTGWPTTLLYESPVLDVSTSAYIYATPSPSITLEPARAYWAGVKNGTVTNVGYRGISSTVGMNFGLVAENSNLYSGGIRRTYTWGNPAPTEWNFNPASPELVGNFPAVSIRMRAV